MIYKKTIGNYGEELVTNYLIKKGYIILKRNIKISHQEIDILAKKNDIFVFIEVKTRTNDLFGCPEEAVNKNKIINLKKAIMNYSINYFLDIDKTRFDVVAVNIDKNKKIAKIKHYLNIF